MPTVIYAVGNMAIKKTLGYLLHSFATVAHKIELKPTRFPKAINIQKIQLFSLGADG